MDTRQIKKLIELVKATGIGELEVKSGDESVRISCQPSYLPTAPFAPAPLGQSMVIPSNAPSTTFGAVSQPDPLSTPPQEEGHILRSPMVGSVYLAATPGAKPFVAVGDHVNVGDTLCLIEAMKMFNKIEADVAGKISARLVDNQQPVEYDQPLFIIDEDA